MGIQPIFRHTNDVMQRRKELDGVHFLRAKALQKEWQSINGVTGFFLQMEDTSKASHILHLFDGEANSFGPLDISERDQLIDTTQVFNT